MSSPSRDASESMLKKLDPTTENGLETTKTSLESYFGNKAINSSNAGLIASALLTGTPLSSYNHASEWTIEANLSTIFESVLQQFGNAVRTQMLNGIANAHHGEISEPVVEFDPVSLQSAGQILTGLGAQTGRAWSGNAGRIPGEREPDYPLPDDTDGKFVVSRSYFLPR